MTPASYPPGGALAAPPGDPFALDQAVAGYDHTQAAIERAAEDLMAALFDGEGQAMAALGEAIGEAQTSLIAAHSRYQGTTSALRDYAIVLADFHREAHHAILSEQEALAHVAVAENDLAGVGARLVLASVNPEYAADVDNATRDLAAATAVHDAAQQALGASRARYHNAQAAWEDAAQVAIDRIIASFEGTNDGFMDHVGHAFAAAGQALAGLADWARQFLAGVWDVVMAAVELYLAAVAVAIAVVGVVVVLVAALALAVTVLAAVLALVIGALVSLVLALLAGVNAYLWTERLGVRGLTQVRVVLGAACLASPLLAVIVVSRIADELSKPPPTVAPLKPEDSADPEALARLDSAIPTHAAQVLAWAGMVDQIGADQRTVVDIAKVTHEDGSVAWIVTVPSTQDWVLGRDMPPSNDVDADLMLTLFPEIPTQYERGVLDAMSQAGIPADNPVLIAGWSLGGIGGGRLIESRDGGYQYEGMICAGSPIDHMAIPRDVNVLQVKHTFDPVHRADLIEGVPDTAHHLSVWDGELLSGPPVQVNPILAHSNDAYVATLEAHTRVDDTASYLFRDFYAIDDPATAAVPRVEHMQYEFSE